LKIAALRTIQTLARFTKNNMPLVVVVPVFAVAGVIFVFRSSAAVSSVSIETEQGTLSSPAVLVSDASASGGSYVKFSGGTVSAPTGFPRLGGMLIGSPHNYHETAYQQKIAKLDIAVLGMYPSWGAGGKTPAQAVREIKSFNPAVKLANYTIMTEVRSDSDPATQPWRTKLFAEKGPNGIGDWWAYDAAGQHTDWSGGSFSAWDTNLTLLTTPDANGDRWPQWKAKYDYQSLLQGTGFDMWYSDNNMWKSRSVVDWNRDGVNDNPDSLTAKTWWRAGQRAYYDTAKTVAPNTPLMLNADSDLDGTVFPSNADDFTQYRQVVPGAFMEHVMGKDWSAETWGGWNTAMGWYRKLKANLTAPQTVLFDAYLPSTTDYQYLRYAFASCLMDDGYFSASTDYNAVNWFDEYDLAGRGGTKWLGDAVDAPQTAAWQNGVYKRTFQNGIVLVNPKGNGSRTVTVPAGYHRFQGTQVPSVNNGQPVSSVTLADRDGLFLVKD
jgi:hypothetical protein